MPRYGWVLNKQSCCFVVVVVFVIIVVYVSYMRCSIDVPVSESHTPLAIRLMKQDTKVDLCLIEMWNYCKINVMSCHLIEFVAFIIKFLYHMWIVEIDKDLCISNLFWENESMLQNTFEIHWVTYSSLSNDSWKTIYTFVNLNGSCIRTFSVNAIQ